MTSYRIGLQAETIAALWLRMKGYAIIARRYRSPFGEIDLIARRGRVLVAVEVKARTLLSDSAEAISFRQQERIRRSISFFLESYPQADRFFVRFDAVLIAPKRWPRHFVNAF